MSNITKLDSYDYILQDDLITIGLSGMSDPTIVDILSEVENSEGLIYVESRYFTYTNYKLYQNNRGTWLDIHVVEIREKYVDSLLRNRKKIKGC